MNHPIDALSEFFELECISSQRGIWRYMIDTPAHKFQVYVWTDDSKNHVFQLTLRDTRQDSLAECLQGFLNRLNLNLPLKDPINLFEGFECSGWEFDIVCVLNSVAHKSFLGEIPELHARSYVVFPAYRCEFSGNETAKEIDFMRKNTVKTIDIYREPSPKIGMWYWNDAQKSGSLGKAIKLDSIEVLRRVIDDLPSDKVSIVKVLNFRGEDATIKREGGLYSVSQDNFRSIAFRGPDIHKWIYKFAGMPIKELNDWKR